MSSPSMTSLMASLMAEPARRSARQASRMASPSMSTSSLMAELMAPRAPRMARMARAASPSTTDLVIAMAASPPRMSRRMGSMSRRRMGSMSRMSSSSARKHKSCPADKPYRSQVAPFRCLKHGSVAARKQGICPPRTDKSGRLRQYVSVTVPGRSPITGNIVNKKRCVVAGGKLAKAALGSAGCPRGKVQAEVVKRVPQWTYDKANGMTYKTPKTNASGKQIVKTVKTLQCVRPRGKHAGKKLCPVGKVLASKRQRGTTPTGGSFNRQVTRCVKPATAAKSGYTVISSGTLPGRAYKRSKGARNLEKTRNPRLRSKKKKARRTPINHGPNPRTKHVGANKGWRGQSPSMTSLMAMAMSPRMIMSLGASPAGTRMSTRSRMAR